MSKYALTMIQKKRQGHSKLNLKAIVLEKVKVNSQQYRKEREHFHIRKSQTFYRGLNWKPYGLVNNIDLLSDLWLNKYKKKREM